MRDSMGLMLSHTSRCSNTRRTFLFMFIVEFGQGEEYLFLQRLDANKKLPCIWIEIWRSRIAENVCFNNLPVVFFFVVIVSLKNTGFFRDDDKVQRMLPCIRSWRSWITVLITYPSLSSLSFYFFIESHGIHSDCSVGSKDREPFLPISSNSGSLVNTCYKKRDKETVLAVMHFSSYYSTVGVQSYAHFCERWSR